MLYDKMPHSINIPILISAIAVCLNASTVKGLTAKRNKAF